MPDALWNSPQVRDLINTRDFGGLVKHIRIKRGWKQADLGQKAHYSASTISRLESGVRPPTDIPMARAIAEALEIPGRVLAEILGVVSAPPAKVFSTADGRGEEDPVRRRTLLTAAGAAVPLHLLAALDDALTVIPAADRQMPGAEVAARLRAARTLFDAGRHPELIVSLTHLLAVAHTASHPDDRASYARLAACYNLATEALSKIGRHDASRLTADRSAIYADLSDSPLAAAAAARALSIVLRHTGNQAAAQRVTLAAASKVEATGLATSEQAAVFAQMLCTASYAAAQSGDRASALELIGFAERAARDLPLNESQQTFVVTPASVSLYKLGVLWSLGDAGAAVDIGSKLNPGQFATAERRSRLHTDMARAWWQWGKAERTATSLLSAFRESPAEVRDRPAIRSIADTLVAQHPRVTGVRELALAVGRS